MPDADSRLTDAHDLALAALQEITPASTIGPAAGYLLEDDGSVSLRFENRLPGYPGWYWTVTVAVVEDAEPTVLEVELLPNEGALLAPEWVPWAERLAEYRAHQVELAEQAAVAAAEAGASDVAVDDQGASDEGDDSDDDDSEDSDDDDSEDSDDDDSEDSDDDDLDESDDDDEDDDDDDDDLTKSRVLHAGDLDGVDIDELDESADDADESDDADDESDEEE